MGSSTGTWLAACMADLTLDLHTTLSQGSTSLGFYSRLSLSVNVFHDILICPGPRFPSMCMFQAVLIAPLEGSTCPNQRSLFALRITSRSSISSCANSLFDLIVATSSGLTLQMSDHGSVIASSGFVMGQVLLAWNIAFRTHELYTRPRVL